MHIFAVYKVSTFDKKNEEEGRKLKMPLAGNEIR